jgi:hypothetical protein
MTDPAGSCLEPALAGEGLKTDGLTPDMVSVSDFSGFTSAVLATFCLRWPGTMEARFARAELNRRRALPYDEWCSAPWECVGKSYCPRDPNCGD